MNQIENNGDTIGMCTHNNISKYRDNSEEVANQMEDQKRFLEEGRLEVNFEG